MQIADIRQRGKTHGGSRQLHNTVIGRDLRLLGRAMARVPGGAVLARMDRDENKQWDSHTGLFLRRRGDGGTLTVQQALAAIGEVA